MSNAALTYLYQEDLYRFTANVVVVLSKSWDEHTSEEQTLLTKILGSVKLSLASVQLCVAPALSMKQLAGFNASKVLIFGSATDGLNAYEKIDSTGFTVIKADALSQLDDVKKKNLWMALRLMFGI